MCFCSEAQVGEEQTVATPVFADRPSDASNQVNEHDMSCKQAEPHGAGVEKTE